MTNIEKIKDRLDTLNGYQQSMCLEFGEQYEQSLEFALIYFEIAILGAWLEIICIFIK